MLEIRAAIQMDLDWRNGQIETSRNATRANTRYYPLPESISANTQLGAFLIKSSFMGTLADTHYA